MVDLSRFFQSAYPISLANSSLSIGYSHILSNKSYQKRWSCSIFCLTFGDNLSYLFLTMTPDEWQSRYKKSDSDLAKALNVHRSLISHIKAGRRNWSPKLAEAMEIFSGGEVHRLELLYPNSYPSPKPEPNTIKKFIRNLFSRGKYASPSE